MTSPTPDGADGAAVRRLTFAVTCSAVGDGSFYVTSTIFFTTVLGLTPGQVGLCLSVAWGAGFVAAAPLGALADRFGLRRAAGALGLCVAGSLALLTAPAVLPARGPSVVWSFLTAVCVYAMAQTALGGVRQALLVRIVPAPNLVAARARLHVAVNAGIGAGAAAGGLALLKGSTWAFVTLLWLDAATAIVAVWLTAGVRLPVDADRRPRTARPGRLDVLRDRRYVVATVLSAGLHLYMPVLGVALPLYLTGYTAAPGWGVALAFAVNTGGVLLLQVPAARTVRDAAGAARALRAAGALLLLWCLAIAAVAGPASPLPAVLVLAAGIVVQVSGEVLLAAGAWHVGFALADPRRPGQWQALFAAGPPLARAVGPVVLTALFSVGPGAGARAAAWAATWSWVALGLVFAAAGALLARTAIGPPRPPAVPAVPLEGALARTRVT